MVRGRPSAYLGHHLRLCPMCMCPPPLSRHVLMLCLHPCPLLLYLPFLYAAVSLNVLWCLCKCRDLVVLFTALPLSGTQQETKSQAAGACVETLAQGTWGSGMGHTQWTLYASGDKNCRYFFSLRCKSFSRDGIQTPAPMICM